MPSALPPRVTQKSIAGQLAISQAVVSRVLSGDTSKVSQITAVKIIEAAQRLSYNKRKHSRTRFIGVVVSQLARDNAGYHVEIRLLAGIQEQARKVNLIPVQHIADQMGVVDALMPDTCGWIVIHPLEPALRQSINGPVVFLHAHDTSGMHDCILEDTTTAVRSAIRRLHGLGHRRFGYFNVRSWGVAQAENYGAFFQVISELDLPAPKPEWVYTPHRRERTAADVERLVRECLGSLAMMSERPSAMFIAGDVYALPFLRLAGEYGLSIPGDLSMFSHDDLPEAVACVPSLSSIAQPFGDMGREAVSRLLARIEHPDLPVRTIRVPMAFNERGSIGPPPDAIGRQS